MEKRTLDQPQPSADDDVQPKRVDKASRVAKRLRMNMEEIRLNTIEEGNENNTMTLVSPQLNTNPQRLPYQHDVVNHQSPNQVVNNANHLQSMLSKSEDIKII